MKCIKNFTFTIYIKHTSLHQFVYDDFNVQHRVRSNSLLETISYSFLNKWLPREIIRAMRRLMTRDKLKLHEL